MIVNASDLNRFEFCPRLIYLTGVLGLKPEPTLEQMAGIVGHYVRKELSFRQSKVLGRIKSAKELRGVLHSELDSIVVDVPFIYREKWNSDCDKILPQVKSEVEKELSLMEEKLKFLVEEVGLQEALKIVTPWKVEYDVKSPTLSLSGRVDKIMKEERLIPVELKTGQAGESVWEADRIQLCAYCMLLEDKFNENVPSGFVEYTRIQERRPVLATEKFRRKVVHTRDKVADILCGKIPDICPHGNGRKCEACSLKEECYKT